MFQRDMVKYLLLRLHSKSNCIARKLKILGLKQLWELCRDLCISFRDQTSQHVYPPSPFPSQLAADIHQPFSHRYLTNVVIQTVQPHPKAISPLEPSAWVCRAHLKLLLPASGAVLCVRPPAENTFTITIFRSVVSHDCAFAIQNYRTQQKCTVLQKAIFRKGFDLSRAILGVPTWSYPSQRAGALISWVFAPPTLVLPEAEHYNSLLIITMKKINTSAVLDSYKDTKYCSASVVFVKVAKSSCTAPTTMSSQRLQLSKLSASLGSNTVTTTMLRKESWAFPSLPLCHRPHRVWAPGHFAIAVGQLTRGSSGRCLDVPAGLAPQLFHTFKPFSSNNSPKLCPPKLSTSARTIHIRDTTQLQLSQAKEWSHSEIHNWMLFTVYKPSNLGQLFCLPNPVSQILVMPQFLQVSSLHPSQSQWNCQTAGETTILERLQQWREEPDRDTTTSVDKVTVGQPGIYQGRDTPVPPITAEQHEQHPPFRSSPWIQRQKGAQASQRTSTGEKNTIYLHFCSVLVAACHGSRAGGSHLLHLDSLGTGSEEGRWSLLQQQPENKAILIPCSPNRPEPFSQKAEAEGNWKFQFWF